MPRIFEKPDTSTSRRMSVTPQKDTSPERALRKILHQNGFRYRTNYAVMKSPRRVADLVFVKYRLAVFVDGCFWHGCKEHVTWPKKNALFWKNKILTNRKRDIDTNKKLNNIGWISIRIWEHEDPEKAARKVIRRLMKIKEKASVA